MIDAVEIVLSIAGSAKNELQRLRSVGIDDGEIEGLYGREIFVDGKTLLLIEKFMKELKDPLPPISSILR